MPYLDAEHTDDIARYTAAQAARHAGHVARLVATGWNAAAARLLAWEKVRDEDGATGDKPW